MTRWRVAGVALISNSLIRNMIWKTQHTLESLSSRHANTAIAHLGIEFTAIGDDFLSARMPVDSRTIQPFGILHGGCSVVLAETLGSSAAQLCVDPKKYVCVGLDINANHIRSVRSGYVTGTARPVHVGRSTQVWSIEIVDEAGKLVCVSRITMAVLDRSA